MLPRSRQPVGSPTLHATIGLMVLLFATALTLSIVTRVEIVARGEGRVVPLSRVQVIQPEFRGRIAEIRVENGAHVTAGDPLVLFDPTDARAELARRKSEAERLRVERARIDAFVAALAQDPGAADFEEVGMAAFSIDSPKDLVEEQRNHLVAELAELRSGAARIDARLLANARARVVTQTRISRIEAALVTQDERLAASEELLERGTRSRLAHLDVLDEATRLSMEKRVLEQEIERALADAEELSAERVALVAGVRARLAERRSTIEARRAELAEELIQARRRLEASTLYAPVDGTVDQLRVFTIGGVEEAGAELMRIVPDEDATELEVSFPNFDAGFLKPGQTAIIRLDAFPAERFGHVRGSLISVSADAIETHDERYVFVARVSPEALALVTSLGVYRLRAGMTAKVDVVTGDRRLISYFFEPIVRAVQESLGER
jgi:hemolysin D